MWLTVSLSLTHVSGELLHGLKRRHLTVAKCFALSDFPGNATAADNEDDEDDLPLSHLADMLQANMSSLNQREAMIADEYVTMDDDLPVMETLGNDWEKNLLRRFKDG